MRTQTVRKIVLIDEEKCNGCGACADKCAEGAIEIRDGKARLMSESYCDGLGACLGECPQDAIRIEERAAEAFSEEAVVEHLKHKVAEPLPCGCPSTRLTQFERPAAHVAPASAPPRSELQHWPVQLALVPPHAPFLRGADLLLVADCVPFAYPGFHQELLKDHAVLVACPKLDDFDARMDKLTQIFRQAGLNSVTVVHMEVPCCSGLTYMARQALQASGKDIPFEDMTIGVRGERQNT